MRWFGVMTGTDDTWIRRILEAGRNELVSGDFGG